MVFPHNCKIAFFATVLDTGSNSCSGGILCHYRSSRQLKYHWCLEIYITPDRKELSCPVSGRVLCKWKTASCLGPVSDLKG